jgi:prolyl-tRNA synthetase
MVPSENGEDQLVECPSCKYAANLERAEVGTPSAEAQARTKNQESRIARVATPGKSTIEQVSAFLRCGPADMIKTLIYVADGQPVAALVRGDHEVNENKLRRVLGASRLELADPQTIQNVTGAPVGFAGPVGLRCRIVADAFVMLVQGGVTGANAADMHLTGVTPGKDFTPDRVADIRLAGDGDPCPRCSGTLRLRRGIEIGHVFKLGTKYSKAMNAKFTDEKGQEHLLIMGCYGIGVNRIIASLLETNHDANGIIWSPGLAPYQVLLVPLNVQNRQLMQTTEKLYEELLNQGLEVLMDDRDARPGFKFKDADLIGIPLRLVLGEKNLQQGLVEVKWRHEPTARAIPLAQAAQHVLAELTVHKTK